MVNDGFNDASWWLMMLFMIWLVIWSMMDNDGQWWLMMILNGLNDD